MCRTSYLWESPSRPCCYPFPSFNDHPMLQVLSSWKMMKDVLVAGLSLATISGFRYGGTTCFNGPVEVWRMNFVACSFVGDQRTIGPAPLDCWWKMVKVKRMDCKGCFLNLDFGRFRTLGVFIGVMRQRNLGASLVFRTPSPTVGFDQLLRTNFGSFTSIGDDISNGL